eukprot:TRINITY_DN1359_c0_g1_i1.p1 TRINITY_DN1359_c0_g1~~TRINITY_DN1359_c0_g1_i1.p1  ORF type:complete len:840 (-),score=165.06 TRINITY_DN1359_c0_g1_i1:389-2908(-)
MAGATSLTPTVSLQSLCLEATKKAMARGFASGWVNPAVSFSSAASPFAGEGSKLGLYVSSRSAFLRSTVCFQRDGMLKGLEDFDSSFASKGSKAYHTQGGYQSSAVVSADYLVADEEQLNMRDNRFSNSRNGLFSFDPSSPDVNDGMGRPGVGAGPGVATVPPVAAVDQLAIASLGISEEIVRALSSRGIEKLFPIQRAVLEPAMQGKDLIARAKTGTGKTLAFGIPILHRITSENMDNRLARRAGRPPRSIVLAPTRELAKQVEREFKDTAPHLSCLCVYGGVSIVEQKRHLERGVDIVVGTPGRVIDLLEQGNLRLQECRFLVLDEADQMLAVGFAEDVEKILERLPPVRQSMLFSATMPTWVNKLARRYLKDPQVIDLVGDKDEKLAEGIKIMAISVGATAKRTVLNDLITVYGKGGKTIVFTQTKRDADEVALVMSRMVGCEALHGDISQNQREKTLNGFRTGIFSVLVATDVAARGLDIPNVDLVIHYEAPNDSETFVHRSGRTGRAGKAGTAILMFASQQQRTLRTIEHDVGCKFQYISAPTPYEVLKSSSDQAAEAISKVHPELKNVFMDTAERLLAEQGAGAFAAAIAHMSGYTQPPPPRSLLTYEEGKVTLRLARMGQMRPTLTSVRAVTGALASLCPDASWRLGKIRIMSEPGVDGAVFDVPEELAKTFLGLQQVQGQTIDAPKVLPPLQDDDEDFGGRDNFGRFSRDGGRAGSRGGRGGGGYGSNSGGYGSSMGGYGNRSSDSYGSGRSSDSYGSGRSSDPYGASRSGGGYGGTPSRSSDPYSSSRIDPYGGSSGGMASRGNLFGGTCYVCGQPGHRASECPSGQTRR